VARYKTTTRQQLTTTLESLEAVNARILGVVLNQVREHRAEVYYGPLAPVKGVAAPVTGPTNRVTATRAPKAAFDDSGRRDSESARIK
jgi:Mrp family chromosome partitioning ATPase